MPVAFSMFFSTWMRMPPLCNSVPASPAAVPRVPTRMGKATFDLIQLGFPDVALVHLESSDGSTADYLGCRCSGSAATA